MKPCDCTTYCGSDPWLADGRAAPCDALKRYQAREAARTALLHDRAEAARRLRKRLNATPGQLKYTVSAEDAEALAIDLLTLP